MSLDRAIASGAEHRRSYRERGKPGTNDRTCRPHGGGTAIPCPYCERDRLVHARREAAALRAALREMEEA